MSEKDPTDPLAAWENATGENLPAHPILNPEQVAAALAKARKLVEDQRIKAATQALVEAEVDRLKQEEGLVTGIEAKDEMVTITLDLAEHSDKITLSGRPYWHGHTYTVPRHIADTLRDIQFKGHRHQLDIEGKDPTMAYRRTREELGIPTLLSMRTGAVHHAPTAAA